eukprot:3342324-Amphidinium_carterae.1
MGSTVHSAAHHEVRKIQKRTETVVLKVGSFREWDYPATTCIGAGAHEFVRHISRDPEVWILV